MKSQTSFVRSFVLSFRQHLKKIIFFALFSHFFQKMGYESDCGLYIGFKIKLGQLVDQINESNKAIILDWIAEDGFIGDCNINDKFQEAREDNVEDNVNLKEFRDEFILIPLTRICNTFIRGHNRVAVGGKDCKFPNMTKIKSKLRKKYKWLKNASVEVILRQSVG